MASIRKTAWFFATALAMAVWMGALGSFRGEAVAGVIASSGADGAVLRDADLDKVRAFLERKVIQQRLQDYGVSPADAMAKVRAMSDRDLHRLASLSDRAGVGSDDALGVLIGLAVLIILVIIIVKLMNKEVIIR